MEKSTHISINEAFFSGHSLILHWGGGGGEGEGGGADTPSIDLRGVSRIFRRHSGMGNARFYQTCQQKMHDIYRNFVRNLGMGSRYVVGFKAP